MLGVWESQSNRVGLVRQLSPRGAFICFFKSRHPSLRLRVNTGHAVGLHLKSVMELISHIFDSFTNARAVGHLWSGPLPVSARISQPCCRLCSFFWNKFPPFCHSAHPATPRFPPQVWFLVLPCRPRFFTLVDEIVKEGRVLRFLPASETQLSLIKKVWPSIGNNTNTSGSAKRHLTW